MNSLKSGSAEYVDYDTMLQDRSNIDHLLQHLQFHYDNTDGVSERDGHSGSGDASSVIGGSTWYAPMDVWKVKADFQMFGEKESKAVDGEGHTIVTESTGTATASRVPDTRVESNSDNASGSGSATGPSVTTLLGLQRAILAAKQVPLVGRAANASLSSTRVVGGSAGTTERVMIDFKGPEQKYPISVPPCPDQITLENSFSSGNLIIDIHSMEGYNFSSEFENVYKGQSNSLTVYRDFITLCKRALLVLDPSLDDALAERYGAYMGRMCLWEREVAFLACGDSLSGTAPQLKANVMTKEPYPSMKLLIGHQKDMRLQFWVRFCPRLTSKALSRSATEAEKLAEKNAHVAMHFCYYRQFSLSNDIVSDFERSHNSKPLGLSDKAMIPPPPKPPVNNSWFVYLVCRQNFPIGVVPGGVSNETGPDVYDDVDDNDEMQIPLLQNEQTYLAEDLPFSQPLKNIKYKSVVQGAANPSPCSELMGWGFNSNYSLGIGEDKKAQEDGEIPHTPRPLPLPASLGLERVASVTCSPRHTIVLSCLGNLYTCGENTEGALGLGDLRSRSHLTLLQWPESELSSSSASPSLPKIVKVSAGSGTIGSHSMAIDSNGNLYGWGSPHAVGLGDLKPVLVPKLIDTFPSSLISRADTIPEEEETNEDDNGEIDNGEIGNGGAICAIKCLDVSCGGGFTVVVLENGKVCSWGVWGHGRLGQGPTPEVKSGRGKKLARYKMRPGLVSGLRGAKSVSCGESHAMCLLNNGQVRVWGQNSCGQLGVGPNYAGCLRDVTRPVTVYPFTGTQRVSSAGSVSSNNSGVASGVTGPSGIGSNIRKQVGIMTEDDELTSVSAVGVCAGAYHSAVLDTDGHVWTWGARGSFCLGHNDAYLNGEWANQVNSVFSISTTAVQVVIPHELLPWCQMWSVPRMVKSILSQKIVQLSAGDLHTCFLSDTGNLHICGTGPVSPPIASASLQSESKELEKAADEADKANDGQVLTREEKEEKLNQKALKAQQLEELIASKAAIVRTPRRPSASWLDQISSKRILLVASSGTRCFALVDEETVAANLTAPMLRKTIFGARSQTQATLDADDATLESLRPALINDDLSVGSYFEQRGRADCMLLVSGKVLLCHRALLATRSQELRAMIAQETPVDDYSINGQPMPTQILLPELHVDAARALLTFLYTDVLPRSCIGNISQLQSLQRCAKNLRIPRLQVLCENLLSSFAEFELNAASEDSQFFSKLFIEMPPPTLARDLGAIVGDPEFADVRFIAEGRALAAHRFILESRSDYFRAMFRSSMAEGFGDNSSTGLQSAATTVDVVVPDTFVGFLRVLIFIYTDTLPDGSDAALLEDLMSADRYNLQDMRHICENMLVCSEENWVDVLHSAELLESSRLRIEVEGYLRDNFAVLDPEDELQENVSIDEDLKGGDDQSTTLTMLRDEFPSFVESVFLSRLDAHPLPPSQLLLQRTHDNTRIVDEADGAPPFPLWALGAGVAVFFIYAQSATVITLGPIIPIVNVLFVVGMIVYLYRHMFMKKY